MNVELQDRYNESMKTKGIDKRKNDFNANELKELADDFNIEHQDNDTKQMIVNSLDPVIGEYYANMPAKEVVAVDMAAEGTSDHTVYIQCLNDKYIALVAETLAVGDRMKNEGRSDARFKTAAVQLKRIAKRSIKE